MGIHITKYKTENGKTRKVKSVSSKDAAPKNGAAETTSDADRNKNAGRSGNTGA